jgi:hypothetical protein
MLAVQQMIKWINAHLFMDVQQGLLKEDGNQSWTRHPAYPFLYI